jgi:hypothetical protein
MKQGTITLQNWSCFSTGSNDPYLAPELATLRICGEAYGHPKSQDGQYVRTSSVVQVDGREVITRSGSVYRLGKINPLYRKWLKKYRPNWNSKQPITVLKEDSNPED